MSARGRRPRFTRAERERVLALAGEGASQREIAERVFGDRRYRGRVERILGIEASALSAPVAPGSDTDANAAEVNFEPHSEQELRRQLLGRAERAMLESSEPPSLVDIERLVRLKRQLETLETVKRLNAIVLRREKPARDG